MTRQIIFNKKLTHVQLKLGVVAIIMLIVTVLSLGGLSGAFGNKQYAHSAELKRADGVELPIVMYHSVLKSRIGDYIVTPDTIDKDFEYLKSKGYETVTNQQLIDYVDGIGELPKKPVMITFDDGYYNNHLYVTPILKKHNFVAVMSAVGKFSADSVKDGHSNANYSHVTWEQLRDMRDSGVWEIANHSYDMHRLSPRKGISKVSGESWDVYRDRLRSDVMKLQGILKDNCGVEPITFTYPFGSCNVRSPKFLKEMGFKTILTCAEGVNVLKVGDREALLGLMRYNRPSRADRGAFFGKMGIK